ncbi:MAG: S8 family serine peptidase, partial [Xanthomonadaceae bacterium]|nr:S8 family serine peptidase [Xanthomonadaceae bacterium]
ISGTSMASPHAAGAAALYLENNPAATPAQVANAIISNATTGKVTNPGTGSPNRLLYTRFGSSGGTPPTITLFNCPDRANSGGGQYLCKVGYSSSTPVTITWNGIPGSEYFFGSCAPSSSEQVTVVVSNSSGSATRSRTFACPTGPIP